MYKEAMYVKLFLPATTMSIKEAKPAILPTLLSMSADLEHIDW